MKKLLLIFFFVSAMMLYSQAQNTLTINFTGMNAHVGQKLEVQLVDRGSGLVNGHASVASVATADFILQVSGITPGHSYNVEIYADLNGNGLYDEPPADHAWRMYLKDVAGDESMDFAHNTNFSSLEWKYLLAFNATGMTPHVGQDFYWRVVDKITGMEVARHVIQGIPSADFSFEKAALTVGHKYRVDFYADLNGNGTYDEPGTDHAWRVETDAVTGDTEINFAHNTNFEDIGFPDLLTLSLDGMVPHVGQMFGFRVLDLASRLEVGRVVLDSILEPGFQVSVPGIKPGGNYQLDFFADLNKNGKYDTPGTDHAWRRFVYDVQGDTVVNFSHNTTFTDIGWDYAFTLHFSDMVPHVGQMLELRLTDKSDGHEVGRTKVMAIPAAEFYLTIPGIMAGNSYQADFYADLSGNDLYDAPGTDHAWRIDADNVQGDTVVDFAHNTNFIDIAWNYLFTLNLEGMTPHVGQKFELRLVDQATSQEAGRTMRDTIPFADFSVSLPGMLSGESYNVDFYADFSGNGSYDAPPADHAWRLTSMNVRRDTALTFVHNTSFTDIQWPATTAIFNPQTGFEEVTVYPNPGPGIFFLTLKLSDQYQTSLKVFDLTGKTVFSENIGEIQILEQHRVDLAGVPNGIYLMEITSGNRKTYHKVIKR